MFNLEHLQGLEENAKKQASQYIRDCEEMCGKIARELRTMMGGTEATVYLQDPSATLTEDGRYLFNVRFAVGSIDNRYEFSIHRDHGVWRLGYKQSNMPLYIEPSKPLAQELTSLAAFIYTDLSGAIDKKYHKDRWPQEGAITFVS